MNELEFSLRMILVVGVIANTAILVLACLALKYWQEHVPHRAISDRLKTWVVLILMWALQFWVMEYAYNFRDKVIKANCCPL